MHMPTLSPFLMPAPVKKKQNSVGKGNAREQFIQTKICHELCPETLVNFQGLFERVTLIFVDEPFLFTPFLEPRLVVVSNACQLMKMVNHHKKHQTPNTKIHRSTCWEIFKDSDRVATDLLGSKPEGASWENTPKNLVSQEQSDQKTSELYHLCKKTA